MSYAIGYIIYGIPYSDLVEKIIVEHEKKPSTYDEDLWADARELAEELGFEFVYTAGGYVLSGWCGVLLNEIDECNNIRVSDIQLIPSDSQKQKAQELINKLPDYIKSFVGAADVHIIWGTS